MVYLPAMKSSGLFFPLCVLILPFSSLVRTSQWKTSKDSGRISKGMQAAWRHRNVTSSRAPSHCPVNITSLWRSSKEPLAALGSWSRYVGVEPNCQRALKWCWVFGSRLRQACISVVNLCPFLYIGGKISRQRHFFVQETERHHGLEEGTVNSLKGLKAACLRLKIACLKARTHIFTVTTSRFSRTASVQRSRRTRPKWKVTWFSAT